MSDVRVCANDGEPLVFTMEFRGKEYVCAVCGRTEEMFGLRAPNSPEVERRLGELTQQYENERAERVGREAKTFPKVGESDVDVPKCGGCGREPEPGVVLVAGKPRSWFARGSGDATEFACSSACIPAGAERSPW